MKSTGMTRAIDDLGRIVVPKEIRRNLNIDEGDSMEIFIEGDNIILHKYQPMCAVCGENSDFVPKLYAKGVKVCKKCYKEAGV